MPSNPVTLQVNLHPFDAPHAVHTLAHHIRVFGEQVDEILFTLDLHQTPASRYRADDYDTRLRDLRALLGELRSRSPKVRVVEVRYDKGSIREVARTFVGRDWLPKKAYNGSPFHAYLFGLREATHDFVLHLDSDMMFGGGSSSWVAEAVEHLRRDPRVLSCSPYPGPPRSDRRLFNASELRRVSTDPPAHEFSTLSTRVFLLDRRRFERGELRIPLCQPNLAGRATAFINYTPPYLALEDCMTALMKDRGLVRLDFLGTPPGLWSLHPVYRSERFYRELPRLIQRIEAGDVPDAQRGHYDLKEPFFDWSDVRARKTVVARIGRRLNWAAAGLRLRLHALTRKTDPASSP